MAAWTLAVLLVNRASFARHLQALVASIIVVGGLGVVMIISIVRNGLDIGLGGVLLLLMFNFGFLRLLFVPSLLAGLIVCLAYNIAAVVGGVSAWLIVANNFFLVSALISGATVTYLLERLFRSQFLAERELAAEREALAQKHLADSRHLDWLTRLGAFLRHEARQPVAQIASSMELIGLAVNEDERVQPYINSASVAAQQVWNLVERATLATDAEAFVRQGAPSFFDLDRLLAEAVENYQQTYSGVKIVLAEGSPAEVRADPALVKEAIGNLLSNAISFARDDSVIHVALEAERRQATVRICNKGPLLEGDAEAMFNPFVSSRAGPSSEHHGLGLYLVRLIAEQYGGAATLANLADGSGVVASISLPLAG